MKSHGQFDAEGAFLTQQKHKPLPCRRVPRAGCSFSCCLFLYLCAQKINKRSSAVFIFALANKTIEKFQ